MQRRRMRSFKIGEISAVDKPAQVGALATIMKKKEDTPAILNELEQAITKLGGQIEQLSKGVTTMSTPKFPLQPSQEEFDNVAKAISNAYGCSLADAEQSARGFFTDEATFNKMAPRVAPQLQGIAGRQEMKKLRESVVKKVDAHRAPSTVETVSNPKGGIKKIVRKGPILSRGVSHMKTLQQMYDEGAYGEPDNQREYGAVTMVGGLALKSAGSFMKKVAEVKKAHNCTHQKAMQIAQSEFPDEFRAYAGR